MTTSHMRVAVLFLATCLITVACGSGSSGPRQVPTDGSTGGSPTGPSTSGPVTLTTPVAVSPVSNQQLSTLRPTLLVENTTSSQQSGTRTYEFQISDRSDFTVAASLTSSFLVSVNQTGVAEGSGGRTQFIVTEDLQPATRMYWRARAVQGTTNSDWSAPATFRTKLIGYSRPGELYDPLIHGETISQYYQGISFVQGKGVRLDSETAHVRYELPRTLTSGEFSVEVEGLQGGESGEKLKIFSMSDTTGNLLTSPYLMNAQYRGQLSRDGANPNNSFSFKVLYGSELRKFEPSKPERKVAMLSGSKTYFWKATWSSSEFRLLVQEGINGPTVYNHGEGTFGAYNPNPHYAFLGANNRVFGSGEGGSRTNAILRHVWISDKPRPESLGSALEAE